MKTVLAYLGGLWLACGALLAFGWTFARVMYRAERDARRCEKAFSETIPTDTRPTTGPLLRRLADEGAEILEKERQRGA